MGSNESKEGRETSGHEGGSWIYGDLLGIDGCETPVQVDPVEETPSGHEPEKSEEWIEYGFWRVPAQAVDKKVDETRSSGGREHREKTTLASAFASEAGDCKMPIRADDGKVDQISFKDEHDEDDIGSLLPPFRTTEEGSSKESDSARSRAEQAYQWEEPSLEDRTAFER